MLRTRRRITSGAGSSRSARISVLTDSVRGVGSSTADFRELWPDPECEETRELMDHDQSGSVAPSLIRTDHAEPSVFQPESLLREARRQRGRDEQPVPDVCLLDPDGDVVRYLRGIGRGHRSESCACYHTELWETEVNDTLVGVIGNAVGAPFAVLVAEELFASGCGLLVSVTSAGQLDPAMTLP